MKRFAAAMALFLSLCALFGCASAQGHAGASSKQKKLVVYTPHSLEFYTPLINEFEQRYHIQVEVVNSGTLEFLTLLQAESQAPKGDVLWGGTISSVYPCRALFEPYVTPNDVYFPPQYRNAQGSLTHFSDVLSVLMVNTDLVGDIPIDGYESLLDARLKGKIAMVDPSKASSGREHLINMLYAMGKGSPNKGWGYVTQLCANMDGTLLNSSSEVYTGVASGKYVVGLTYEEGAANYVQEGAPIQIVYMKEGVIAKPDGIYIIKNAKNIASAKKFVDFLTTKDVQSMLAEEFKHRPLRPDVDQPELFPSKNELNIIFEDSKQVEQEDSQWTSRFLALIQAQRPANQTSD